MDLTPQSEAIWLRGLTSADRVRFLARLAHNLTITGRLRALYARSGLLDEDLPRLKDFIEQLRVLNEIQYRISGYLCYVLEPDEDPDFLPVVAGYVLKPHHQSLREALHRDWREARSSLSPNNRWRGP